MADMRASDWLTIGIAGAILLACLFGTMVLIAAWPHIVSSLSRIGGRMAEEGRARRAYRQRMYNMSSSVQSEPVPRVVPGAVPVPSTGATTIDIPSLARNLTEAQYVELGARLVDRRGKPVFSGKKLYTLAGGNHDEFLASMRRWRGEDTNDEETPYITPIVGRPTRAVFETDKDFPYQAPAQS
jgi:hypothetical protein